MATQASKTRRGTTARRHHGSERRGKTSRERRRSSTAALLAYCAKRHFDRTPEPDGEAISTKRRRGGLIFVVQEHHASKLHYDFRLEVDGVLKSWAVPKEPTLDPSVKRLAVRVEDHPLAYATFRGDIPAGQYGAGHVEIWDHGTYENAKAADGADVAAAIDAGRVDVELHGGKLKGRFALVRTRGMGREGENWLLMKLKDRYAKAGSGESEKKPRAARRAIASAARAKVVTRGKPGEVEFSHTDKVLFPEPGYTKGDVLDYYRRVAPKLLPHLRNRPVTLERLPDGLNPGAPRFWQKNTPAHYPAWIPRVELPSEDGKPVRYALVNDEPTLLYLVNQGALTFHVWFSRVGNLARPDFVLFDLDPGESPFTDVVKIAKTIHARLEAEDLPALVKTSGKSGLHVLVPWQREGGYDEARAWAMAHAEAVAKELPEIATVERLKAKRGGRVYVDVIQNAAGHHAVPPYVLRATPGATASTPLDWKELTPKLDPKRFDLKTALKRFEKQNVDPMSLLTEE